MRNAALSALAALLRRWSPAQIERRLGSRSGQRAIFAIVARSFVPEAANGFQGCLAYQLTFPATRRPPAVWSLEVAEGRARARRGPCRDPALTVTLQLADFLRVGAGELDPVVPILQGRGTVSGPLELAMRIPEMFGATRPR